MSNDTRVISASPQQGRTLACRCDCRWPKRQSQDPIHLYSPGRGRPSSVSLPPNRGQQRHSTTTVSDDNDQCRNDSETTVDDTDDSRAEMEPF